MGPEFARESQTSNQVSSGHFSARQYTSSRNPLFGNTPCRTTRKVLDFLLRHHVWYGQWVGQDKCLQDPSLPWETRWGLRTLASLSPCCLSNQRSVECCGQGVANLNRDHRHFGQRKILRQVGKGFCNNNIGTWKLSTPRCLRGSWWPYQHTQSSGCSICIEPHGIKSFRADPAFPHALYWSGHDKIYRWIYCSL